MARAADNAQKAVALMKEAQLVRRSGQDRREQFIAAIDGLLPDRMLQHLARLGLGDLADLALRGHHLLVQLIVPRGIERLVLDTPMQKINEHRGNGELLVA